MIETRHKIQDTRHKIQDTRTQDTGYRIQDKIFIYRVTSSENFLKFIHSWHYKHILGKKFYLSLLYILSISVGYLWTLWK